MNYIIGIANVIVVIVLIPTLINKKSFVPRSTSIPTVVALLMLTFVFFNQRLFLGATMETLSSCSWLFVAIMRGNEIHGNTKMYNQKK
jgi:hypothetical protein